MISGSSVRGVSSGLFPDDEDRTKARSRVSKPPPPDATPEFQAMIEKDNARAAKRRSRTTIGASVFNRALQEVDEMVKSGEWDNCTARHLVALYDMMHTKCYGIEPAELGPKERYRAVFMVSGLIKREFGDDILKMVAYMRWVWTREIGREKWRRENNSDSNFRIGFRMMFSPSSLLTDYRLAQQRKRA